jgi:hypothetical protein
MAKGEWKRTRELIDKAIEILEEQNPMTVRQLFYRLVSIGALENSRSCYTHVSRLVTKARLDGRIDFGWIVDRSRPEYMKNVWKDAAAYGKTISHAYHLDYWELQPTYAEIWCEKDAVIGSIEDVTRDLGVRIVVGRGFQSTTRVQEIAQRLYDKSQDKQVHIFYLGDHDPSGINIQEDIVRRVDFAQIRLGSESLRYNMTRLAIYPSDITAFKLPALQVKDTDSRAEAFKEKYGEGKTCVELDALPPTVLRQRIKDAVTGILDMEKWNRAIDAEKVELASIQDFVKGLNNLKHGQESV